MGKRVIAIVILVALVVATAAVVVMPTGADLRRPVEAVAVIHLDGPIEERTTPAFAGAVITPQIVRQRLQTVADRGAQAVVLRVNSPGGAVGASQEIAAMVRDYPDPVVVSMGDQAASGGYFIAAPANRIVAQPGTLTGSIGVIFLALDVDELLDRLGVDLNAITAGEHKDMFLPGELTPERRELLQGLTDTLYDQFVEAVATGRDMSPEDVLAVATGELFTGEQALELGLVDTLGGVDEAVAQAAEAADLDDPVVIDIRPGVLEQLFGSGSTEGFGGWLVGRGPDELAVLRELLYGYATPRYEAP